MLIVLDRRPALRSILRSLLVTYSTLMSSLLLPPPLNPEEPPEWQKRVDWISNLVTNLMAAANDLRPVQVICASDQKKGANEHIGKRKPGVNDAPPARTS